MRIQFDYNYDGELDASEGYKAAAYLEDKRRSKVCTSRSYQIK